MYQNNANQQPQQQPQARLRVDGDALLNRPISAKLSTNQKTADERAAMTKQLRDSSSTQNGLSYQRNQQIPPEDQVEQMNERKSSCSIL